MTGVGPQRPKTLWNDDNEFKSNKLTIKTPAEDRIAEKKNSFFAKRS